MASTNSPSRPASPPAAPTSIPAPASATATDPATDTAASRAESQVESRAAPETPRPAPAPSLPATATGGPAFEPEQDTHFDRPDGGYYAGSRKDFPLPAARFPLPRTSQKRLSEPAPGTKGGRQRHYTDDPDNEIGGFWTESGHFVDWPLANDTPAPEFEELEREKLRHDWQMQEQQEAREKGEEKKKTTSTSEGEKSASESKPEEAAASLQAASEDRDRDQQDPAGAAQSNPTANATVGTRRQANGTIGSVYSGNKIRNLKKDDGVPMWRRDIQYRFLRMVFEDTTPVFTRVCDGQGGLTFTDIYIDAMAKSSKTSKVLKDKLFNDRPAAINMAMVCLLVNFGRMNTTLNFFPEMRAQLRTYHSIPSLQAHQDSSAYKQLQDAPRLKSILKASSEDSEQPNTIEKLKETPAPRTNPVNLIFVLAQYAPKISEVHFRSPHDFFDLVIRANLSSKSRARAFLWLMWFYLESDFSDEAALKNPFGPGTVGEGTGNSPLKIPLLEDLTEEEADAENVDTQDEILYGEEKQRERKRILDDDDVVAARNKRLKKDNTMSDDQMSGDIPMSGTPLHPGREKPTILFTPLNPGKRSAPGDDEEEELQTPVQALRSRNKRKRDSSTARSAANAGRTRIVLKTKMDQTPDATSPAPPGASHPILHQYGTASPAPGGAPSSSRRPRPLTQHQIAIEQNRRQRVDYILAQRRSEEYRKARELREQGSRLMRAGRLLQCLPADYDTEDDRSWGKGGLCLNPDQEEDFGETGSFYFSMLKKVARRMHRWDWQAMASGDQDIGPNGLLNDYHLGNTSANGGMGEEGEAEIPTAPPVKSSRGGRRDRKSNADKLLTPDPSRLAAPTSTGKRQYIRRKPLPERKPAGEGGRKSRGGRSKAATTAATSAANPDAATNKTLAIKTEAGAAGASAAGSELGLPSSPSRGDVQMKDTGDRDHDDEEAVLDDIDKDILGDHSVDGGDDDVEGEGEGESHLSASPHPDPDLDQEPGSEAIAAPPTMVAAGHDEENEEDDDDDDKTLPASINDQQDSDDSTEEDVVATALTAAAETPDPSRYAQRGRSREREREHIDKDGDELMAHS